VPTCVFYRWLLPSIPKDLFAPLKNEGPSFSRPCTKSNLQPASRISDLSAKNNTNFSNGGGKILLCPLVEMNLSVIA
jgi:hypothetical protein